MKKLQLNLNDLFYFRKYMYLSLLNRFKVRLQLNRFKAYYLKHYLKKKYIFFLDNVLNNMLYKKKLSHILVIILFFRFKININYKSSNMPKFYLQFFNLLQIELSSILIINNFLLLNNYEIFVCLINLINNYFMKSRTIFLQIKEKVILKHNINNAFLLIFENKILTALNISITLPLIYTNFYKDARKLYFQLSVLKIKYFFKFNILFKLIKFFYFINFFILCYGKFKTN